MGLTRLLSGIGAHLTQASEAHARWELQMSRNILGSRRRRWMLLILLLLAVAPICASAAWADTLPQTLGGRRAYAPAVLATGMLAAAVVIGLIAGLITGCIGAGGGFIITPAMMSVGVKGIMAVGTDTFHIFAKAIMGTAVHRKMGNVSVRLAVAFVFGSVPGGFLGAVTMRAIYARSPLLSNAFISTVYALLLGLLGFFALGNFLRLRRRARDGLRISAHGAIPAGNTAVAEALQSVRLPPRVAFGRTGIWAGFIVLPGFVVGFVAAIMGVGGGFLTFPMFVYVIGVSEPMTVGTDIFQIVFTSGYISIVEYAAYGYVFYTLAMGMLLGSLVGIQIGSFASKAVPPIQIRGFYALAILAGFANRLMALPRQLTSAGVVNLPKPLTATVDTIGQVLFFAIIGVFGLWVIGAFFVNFRKLRGEFNGPDSQ